MNLPKIQALTAPLSAPIPSALGVASEAFNYFYIPDSLNIVSWFAAIGAFLGIETLGGASCYALVKLHRQKNYGIEFWIAFTGILAYIGSGVYSLAHSPIIIFFFLAPFSYFAYSILRNMETEHIERVSETEAQIKLIEAETRRTNAETRKARAEQVPVIAPVRDSVRSEQPEQHKDKIYAILAENPNVGPREMSRLVGCSVSTASKWIAKHATQAP